MSIDFEKILKLVVKLISKLVFKILEDEGVFDEMGDLGIDLDEIMGEVGSAVTFG